MTPLLLIVAALATAVAVIGRQKAKRELEQFKSYVELHLLMLKASVSKEEKAVVDEGQKLVSSLKVEVKDSIDRLEGSVNRLEKRL